ncbi:MAG: hypothetical protein DRI88_07370 [Bacteroidetes bacterium]|nr:MAG: hypothetical protein DRI88_07370 [Bacteroidota bacterium]RLD73137.1 MAG: hypothetical protein DRI87_04730 [Bacteroidota bacterium]RLD85626.1 MAG: hypothetical protein DRJ02_10035 [Bacteroidota bacterium]
MKNYIFGFIAFIIILTMYSCKGKLIGEFYLSSEMKAQIPFKGFEKIYFNTDNRTVFLLSGDDRFYQIYESSECINCRDYSLFEKEWIYFKDNLHELRLVLDTGRDNNYFSIGFDVNETSFGCSFISPLSQETLRDDELYHDSLVVNNKTYHNVFSDTLTHIGSIGIDPYPIRCYYSTGFGVVKIDFSDSTSWELENIEW